jgi:hypothetical protein
MEVSPGIGERQAGLRLQNLSKTPDSIAALQLRNGVTPSPLTLEAWEVLAFLYERGFAFRGCGCDAGGYIPPKRVRDIAAFLEVHYPGMPLPKKKRYARTRA